MKTRIALAAAVLLATTAVQAAVLPANEKTDTTPAQTPAYTPDPSWSWMADNDAAVRPLRPKNGKGDGDDRVVPEPGILALLVVPALALAGATRRRRRG